MLVVVVWGVGCRLPLGHILQEWRWRCCYVDLWLFPTQLFNGELEPCFSKLASKCRRPAVVHQYFNDFHDIDFHEPKLQCWWYYAIDVKDSFDNNSPPNHPRLHGFTHKIKQKWYSLAGLLLRGSQGRLYVNCSRLTTVPVSQMRRLRWQVGMAPVRLLCSKQRSILWYIQYIQYKGESICNLPLHIMLLSAHGKTYSKTYFKTYSERGL